MSVIIVSIDNVAVNEKSGTKGDKAWKMRFQPILISGLMVDGFESRYPRETTIQLEENAAPYPVGQYVIASESFYFGDFGRFTMGRMRLQPIAAYMADLERTLGVTVTAKPAKAA